MALFKHTLIFDYPAVAEGGLAITRSGGWSESLYADSVRDHNHPIMKSLVQARAKILAKELSIIGYRISDVSKKSGTISGKLFAKGGSGKARDVANIAIQFSAYNGGNKLRQTLHGFPDDFSTFGDNFSNKLLRDAMKPYWNELPEWKTRVRDLEKNRFGIASVTEEGVMTLTAAQIEIADNDQIAVLRPKCALKRKLSVYRVVTATNGGLTLTLADWDGGVAFGGEVRKHEIKTISYVNDYQFDWITTRKIGRPSFSHRGHR